MTFLQDATLRGIFPHTHVRGKRWSYTLELPDGTKRPLLSVPKYDFNWQTYYMFSEPIAVPKGARIVSTAWYDNSAANKSNPDPTIAVKWGDQTWEEMQYTGILFSMKRTVTAARAEAARHSPARLAHVLEPVVADRGALLHAGLQHHVADFLRGIDGRHRHARLAVLLGEQRGVDRLAASGYGSKISVCTNPLGRHDLAKLAVERRDVALGRRGR